MGDSFSFEVRYRDPDELVQANERELRHGGCVVKDAEAPGLFSRVKVQFHLPDGPTVEVHGTVVNTMATGFFVEFEKGIEYEALKSAVDFVIEVSGVLRGPEDIRKQADVLETEDPRAMGSGEIPRVPAVPPEESEPANTADSESDRPDALAGNVRPVWEMIDLGGSVPLHKQIEDLNSAEKVRLARHATRPVRELLVQDNDARVHVEVVKNPKITQFEIMEYIANPRLAPGALRWVSTMKRYMRLPPVVLKLVMNPNTPPDVGGRLVMLLPQQELLRVARSNQINESVTRKAKKKLMEQGVI